jgi:hypothetical protein
VLVMIMASPAMLMCAGCLSCLGCHPDACHSLRLIVQPLLAAELDHLGRPHVRCTGLEGTSCADVGELRQVTLAASPVWAANCSTVGNETAAYQSMDHRCLLEALSYGTAAVAMAPANLAH